MSTYFVNCVNEAEPTECVRNALRVIEANRFRYTNMKFAPTNNKTRIVSEAIYLKSFSNNIFRDSDFLTTYILNPLSAKPTSKNCLSMFDHFSELAFKGFIFTIIFCRSKEMN